MTHRETSIKEYSAGLSYDDVLLMPRYSDIKSRSEIDVSTDLGNGLILELPILASPMDTISEAAMALEVGLSGGAAVIHRYNTPDEQAAHVKLAKEMATNLHGRQIVVGAAVGVTGDFIERAMLLLGSRADFICIDVAHGHHVMMKDALEKLRILLGDKYHIMAGNVATIQGARDLSDWGANSIRCNIGGGSICSTRIQTGHGMPGLQTILDCAQVDRDVAIIADGGITNSGDMVKAYAAGADVVMCGSLLSGTDEAPGKIIEESDGTRWKTYRGMASKEAQIKWRGNYSSFEGVSARVPYRGSVKSILKDLEKGIRSGLSYSGARSIQELQTVAAFIKQTTAGIGESKTHITGRQW
jgi:IMP dehydrogenase